MLDSRYTSHILIGNITYQLSIAHQFNKKHTLNQNVNIIAKRREKI